MDWTGHKTDAVFRRYDITSGADLANATEKVAAYVEEAAAKPSKVVALRQTSKKLASGA